MSLNPSNQSSEQITGQKAFHNVAGMGRNKPHDVDQLLLAELKEAGIEWYSADNRYGESQTRIIGVCHGWTFRRAWYYWIASGPRLPLDYARPLHELHGKSVRVEGHCGCPAPADYCGDQGVGWYHVDNASGLKALADTLKVSQA